MQLTIRQNSQAQTLRFLLVDDQNARGRTGLKPDPGIKVAYVRDNEERPIPIGLAPGEGEVFSPGSFREIDPDTMPGLYELGLPDAVLAEGARTATLMVRAPGTRLLVIHIDLVAYDPYDGYRLGLDCLTRDARHDVIATAFREVVPEIVEEFMQRS